MTDAAPLPEAFAAELRARAAELARRAAEQPNASPQALRRLIDLCRAEGRIAEAGDLAERLVALAPQDLGARALSQALKGRVCKEAAGGAIPFVRLLDFLPPERRAEVDALVAKAFPQFQPTTIYRSQGAPELVETARRSMGARAEQPLADLFLPLIKRTVRELDLLSAFDLDFGGVPPRYELEVTCHGDGAFFTAHTDSEAGDAQPRLITFVYYFNTQPKRFTGGDLLIYDQPEQDGQAKVGFTRIEPLDNSIVFFPSFALHEVLTVSMPDGDLREGRMTLNGWVRSSEGAV